MAKAKKVPSNSTSRHHRRGTHMLSCNSSKGIKPVFSKQKKRPILSNKKEWDKATCSVCLEYPHNAVLLLCSSHDKGCRPYMCATGRRYSNCLEQYKKAYMKLKEVEIASQGNAIGNPEHATLNLESIYEKGQVAELLCPLCRGQVKGCTIVETARKYFNGKKRMCMQEKCAFSGNYKDLKKHVRAEHPWARPREVDPVLEEKWKRLEQQRERNDVISTVISLTPGAVVRGDYVIERSPFYQGSESDGYESDDLTPLENLGRQRVTSALMYGDGHEPIESSFSLNRLRSARLPVSASHACHRYRNNRLMRRRRAVIVREPEGR